MELKLEESHERLEQTNLDLKQEIAARKKTETALRESKKLYRDIFEKNNAIKWLLDPSSGEIIDANPAACEFYQYSHEEITKLRLWDINIENEADVRELLDCASSGGNTEFMFKHRLASGEIRDVQVYTGALESGGKKIHAEVSVSLISSGLSVELNMLAAKCFKPSFLLCLKAQYVVVAPPRGYRTLTENFNIIIASGF